MNGFSGFGQVVDEYRLWERMIFTDRVTRWKCIYQGTHAQCWAQVEQFHATNKRGEYLVLPDGEVPCLE